MVVDICKDDTDASCIIAALTQVRCVVVLIEISRQVKRATPGWRLYCLTRTPASATRERLTIMRKPEEHIYKTEGIFPKKWRAIKPTLLVVRLSEPNRLFRVVLCRTSEFAREQEVHQDRHSWDKKTHLMPSVLGAKYIEQHHPILSRQQSDRLAGT